MLSAFEELAIAVFAERASLAARIFFALGKMPPNAVLDASRITQAAGLTVSEENATTEILRTGAGVGFFSAQSAHNWAVVPSPAQLTGFGLVLESVGYYRAHVHKDRTQATVVLTRPAKPSQLEEALADFGWKTAKVEPTDDAFLALASAATRRFVVMTPFFDVAGALWLRHLFEAASGAAERVLVLRHVQDSSHPGYPKGFDSVASWLAAQKVRVFNYALPRPEGKGLETFHAKVVLSDETEAYIGSSNMNQASLAYSMELGVTVLGDAAMDVAVIVNAILKVANEIQRT